MASEHEPTAALLRLFVGTWEGTGRGSFPTLEPFRYRELTVFEHHELEPRLRFEQRTWLVSDGLDDGEPAHHELGFVRLLEDGSVELANAQGSGRVEVLSGSLVAEGDGALLSLQSAVLANDDRMVRTTRSLHVGADELRYEVSMTTDEVETHTLHLEALLVRR